MFVCFKDYIGTKGEAVDSKIALNHAVVYATDRSKAVVPVLFLFCAVYTTGRFMLSLALLFVLVFLRSF